MPVFYLMVGIPGSGKSTEAERLAHREGAILVSSDGLRKQLTGSAGDRSRDGAVFGLAFKTIKKALAEDKDVIYDATNLIRSDRMRVLKILPPGVRKVCVYLKTPSGVAMGRNMGRARVVPGEVIRRMRDTLKEPELEEGWDEIRVVQP